MQRKVNIKPELLSGIYTNSMLIHCGPSEFVIDFIQTVPSMEVAEIKARMIMHPMWAKVLLGALGSSIKQFEDQYGEIPPVPKDAPKGTTGIIKVEVVPKSQQN